MKIKVINSDKIVIKDLQTALDLMMNARYGDDYEAVVINKSCQRGFFSLKQRAGR